MRFGYFTLSDNPVAYGEKRRDPNQLLCDIVEEAIEAESLGFNSAWLPEHHFGAFGVIPTPSTVLAYIAGKTERLRLAPATVLLPCTQPLRTAEEYAVLDVLSNGRAIFSAGRGYDEREYRAFGVPFSESRTRFDEELLIIRKAWTEEAWTWQGQHHTIPDPLTVYPRPVQQPHPPVYVACFSEPTMRMAAAQGFNIIFAPFAASMMFGSLKEAVAQFKEYATAAGHPDSTAMCSYFVAIADSEAEKQAARERLLFYLRLCAAPAFPGDPSKAPPHIRYFAEIVQKIRSMKPEDLGERSIVTGSREEVIDHLRRVEDAGIEEVICYFNFGAQPHQDTLHQMERFSREVMPAFAPVKAVAAATR